MAERNVGVRQLARAVYCAAGHVSNLRSGKARPSAALAAGIDDYLQARGAPVAAAREDRGRADGAGPAPAAGNSSGAVVALRAAMTDDPADLEIAGDGLAELVRYYAQALAVAPSAQVYEELLSARTFAGNVLGRALPKDRPDLTVTTGWLSSLLAISATDLGDHAAAVVWCADTERRARDAEFPDLLGWAALTRAAIAYYQGDPARSVAAARRGQALAPLGSVAHAKLAAQEMRCLAVLGDFDGMTDARQRAVVATAGIRREADAFGVYSVPPADDPPYTATSLLLAGRHADAAELTRRIVDTGYRSLPAGGAPTSYARTLLILALAAAGLGDADEAAATGAVALEAGRVVWPTMVLAGKLARSLDQASPGSVPARDFRDRFSEARARLVPTAQAPAEGS
jgi:hypothetical protein